MASAAARIAAGFGSSPFNQTFSDIWYHRDGSAPWPVANSYLSPSQPWRGQSDKPDLAARRYVETHFDIRRIGERFETILAGGRLSN